MFRKFYGRVRQSRLAQAGVALVLLGAGVQFLEELGTVDLASLPFVGKYAGAILAVAGVCKVILRASMVLLTAFGSTEESK